MKKTMVTVIIIAVITGVGVLFFLGTINDMWYFFQQPKNCAETPFARNCNCNEGDEKLKIERAGVPRWFCENEDKLINIDNAGWESEAEQYAIEKLAEIHPDCDMKNCDRSTTQWNTQWGYHEFERRIVNLDCDDSESGFRFATIEFDIIEGAIIQAGCGSYDDIVQETVSENDIALNFEEPSNRLKSGYILSMAEVTSRCEDKDNGIGITTVYAPEGNIGRWKLIQGSFGVLDFGDGRKEPSGSKEGTTIDLISGTCEIIESTADYATVSCDTQCPHVGFAGSTIELVGVYSDLYFEEKAKCQITSGDRFIEGDTIVCKDDNTKYECVSGEWTVLSTSVSTTQSRCPA